MCDWSTYELDDNVRDMLGYFGDHKVSLSNEGHFNQSQGQGDSHMKGRYDDGFFGEDFQKKERAYANNNTQNVKSNNALSMANGTTELCILASDNTELSRRCIVPSTFIRSDDFILECPIFECTDLEDNSNMCSFSFDISVERGNLNFPENALDEMGRDYFPGYRCLGSPDFCSFENVDRMFRNSTNKQSQSNMAELLSFFSPSHAYTDHDDDIYSAYWDEDDGHLEERSKTRSTRQEADFSLKTENVTKASFCSTERSPGSTNFQQLLSTVNQLDINTKLCLRDGLYRLARSAKKRHGLDTFQSNKRSKFMDVETCTNPMDRTIMHLLFHGCPASCEPCAAWVTYPQDWKIKYLSKKETEYSKLVLKKVEPPFGGVHVLLIKFFLHNYKVRT